MKNVYVGKPIGRVDGFAKVTGEAKYAAEHGEQGLIYGVAVSSAIARGKILSIDSKNSCEVPGVIEVISHLNRRIAPNRPSKHADQDSPPGEQFVPLSSPEVLYYGQPVALVLAETFEAARRGAQLVLVEYEQSTHCTDISANLSLAESPKKMKMPLASKGRGKFEKAWASAFAKIEARHFDAIQHHNPMEPHASTVIYEAGNLMIFDKTQGTLNSQGYVCNAFSLPKDQVQVRAPFVGGAFGSGLRPQYQLYLAVLGALSLKRSVKVVLSRQQMFTFGHRPAAIQDVRLAANERGALLAIEHKAFTETSRFENYNDNVVGWSEMLYHCDNVSVDHQLVRLDLFSPLDMRAPGAVTGIAALETAVDDLAYALKLDPLEFRLRNYAEKNEAEGKPFSSKELRDCYSQGASRFGWRNRPLEPRAMRRGKSLVGWGMATGVWEAFQMPASASACLDDFGKLVIRSAVTDIGTGTYTVMSQVAADALGIDLSDVTIELGNTNFPMAPLQGGSWTAASVGPAVQGACENVRSKLLKLARNHPELKAVKEKDLFISGGIVGSHSNPSLRAPISEVLRAAKVEKLEDKFLAAPNLAKQKKYSRSTYSAVFVEVEVDEDLGTVNVNRVVSAIGSGRILNFETARSQILGGITWGISQALHEESLVDHRIGHFVNHSFAEYHIPTSKDVAKVDVIFVEEPDPIVSPLGVKGLGEIGVVGVAPAISNAIFHATGKRINSLPITLDKLL